jgi:hypothetical protein
MDDGVPVGTQVLNTTDGEVGRIAGWSVVVGEGRTAEVNYDVETQFGPEQWQRPDFVLMSELDLVE